MNAKKKKRSWFLRILLTLLLLLIVLVIVLPLIASSGAARGFALKKINASIPGELDIDALSLGYLKGADIKGMRWHDDAGNLIAEAGHVTTDYKLKNLLFDSSKQITLELDRPEIHLHSVQINAKEDAPTKEKPKEKASKEATELPPHRAIVRIKDGIVTIKGKDVYMEELNFDLDYNGVGSGGGAAKSPLLKLSGGFQSPGAAESLSIDGTADFGSTTLKPEKVNANLFLKTTGWEFGPLLTFLNGLSPVVPTGSLRLVTDTKVNGSLANGFAAQSTTALRNIKLAGGAIGDDAPSFDELGLTVDIKQKENGFDLNRFQFQSPFASANLRGVVDQLPNFDEKDPLKLLDTLRANLRGTADILLPELLNSLPNTLNLQEGLAVNQGRINIELSGEAGEGSQDTSVKVALAEGLAGVVQGNVVRLDPPFDLNLTANRNGSDELFGILNLASSMISGSGTGTMDQAVASFDLNLDEVRSKLGQFVDLSQWQLGGTGHIELNAQNLRGETRSIEANTLLTAMNLGFENQSWLSQENVQLFANTSIDSSGKKLSAPSVKLRSGFGNADINMASIVLPAEGGLPSELKGLDIIAGQINFDKATRLLTNMGILTNGMRLAGNGSAEIKGNFENGALTLPTIVVQAEQIAYAQGTQQVTQKAVTLTGNARAQLNAANQPVSASLGNFVLDTDAGSFTVSKMDAQKLDSLEDRSIELAANGQIDLGVISALMQSVGALTNTMAIAGSTALDLDASFANNRLTVRNAKAMPRNFQFTQGEKQTGQINLDLATAGSLDLSAKTVDFSGTSLTAGFGNLTIPTFTVGDLDRAMETLNLQLNSDNVSIPAMLSDLGGFSPLPPKNQVSGNMSMNVTAKSSPGQPAAFDAKLDLKQFQLADRSSGASRVLFAEDQADLRLKGQFDQAGESLQLSELMLNSSPLGFNASGGITEYTGPKNIAANGNLAFDLDKISGLLEGLTGKKFVMNGKQSKPFSIKTALAPADGSSVIANTELSAELYAEHMELYGVSIDQLSIPAQVKDSLATVNIAANVNEGKLLLQPTFDLRGDTPVMSMPTNSMIITNFTLTDEISNELLGLMHPIFKGASVAGGSFDLNMKYLDIPLGPDLKKHARFATQLGMNNVSLEAKGMVRLLLDLAKVKETSYTIEQDDIELTCEESRVHATPLKIRAGSFRMEMSGSVGFDQTLQYYASVPATESMVGSSAYPYLKGTSFRIPIGGTVTKPRLDTAAMTQAIASTAKQAAMTAARNEGSKLLKDKLGDKIPGIGSILGGGEPTVDPKTGEEVPAENNPLGDILKKSPLGGILGPPSSKRDQSPTVEKAPAQPSPQQGTQQGTQQGQPAQRVPRRDQPLPSRVPRRDQPLPTQKPAQSTEDALKQQGSELLQKGAGKMLDGLFK